MTDSRRFLIVRVSDGEPYGDILATTATEKEAETVLEALAGPETQTVIVDLNTIHSGPDTRAPGYIKKVYGD